MFDVVGPFQMEILSPFSINASSRGVDKCCPFGVYYELK
jgi:hypothetical protein